MTSEELLLFGSVFGALIVASVAGEIMKRGPIFQRSPKFVEEVVSRTNAWWFMTLLLVIPLKLGYLPVVVLFFLISMLALREYLTLVPSKRADHRALFWSFMIVCPLHYYLLALDWYGLYSIFIPVYAFLFIPSRMVVQQDCENFLERAAKIQWGLMLCVYAVGYAPALLKLVLPGYGQGTYLLLFYLVFLTEVSDVLQFIAGKAFGKRKILPGVSPNKTWEGLLGGLLGTTVLGFLFAPATPFTPLVSAAFGAGITVVGFFGGLTMSAVKRDAGVKDYGTIISGHGGVMDRIDSLIFTAPLFFHVVRYFFT